MNALDHAEKALKNLNSQNFALYGFPTSEIEFYTMYKPVVGVKADGTNIFAEEPSQYVISYSLFAAEVARLQALEPIRIAEANRKAAYIAEADPLFFKAQRGEATMEEWQDKVAEIKQRFPK